LSLLDEDVVLVMNGRSLQGAAAFCAHVAASVRELQGVRVELERILAESDDTVVVQARYYDASPAPRSDRAMWGWRLPISLCEVFRIADGRLVEYRNYVGGELADQLSSRDVAPWPGIAQLVAEQAALRRVATLVARGGKQSEVFDAIVTETAELLGEDVSLLRFGPENARTFLARHGTMDVGDLTAITVSGYGALADRLQSGHPVRIDDYADVSGGGELARRLGVVASAVAPLVVQGAAWGALMVNSRVGLAVGIEDRLAQFADLAATAIANAQSRAELQLLADEQAALRRVAELVARGAATEEVFDQVTSEAERLLGNATTTLLRYSDSGSKGIVLALTSSAGTSDAGLRVTRGDRVPLPGDIGPARVWRTGRASRVDDYQGVAGAEGVRAGVRASVSVPLLIEGRLWGVLIAGSLGPPLPIGTEARLTRFCELVAAAIANAESRSALTASRARIIAT
jgi:GAF domain-containing protein